MIPPTDAQLLPQQLDKIVATLHSRLGSDIEAQDYHFLVDPIDHHHITRDKYITRDDFPQLTSLREAFPHCNIIVHFDPTTGEMSVSTMTEALYFELRYLLLGKTRAAITAHPQMHTLVAPHLGKGTLASEVPQCLMAVYQSDYDGTNTPHLVISFSTFAGKRNKKGPSKSTPAHVMTRYPGLQTMIRLDFGGLATSKSVDGEHHEQRIQRIASLSSVLTWTRDEYGNIVSTCENLNGADGELRLHLPGGGNHGGSSSELLGQSLEVVVKFSEILDTMRTAGRYAPLGGSVPLDNGSTLQSSMIPFPSFPYHGFTTATRMNIGAHVARLLGLGNNTTAPAITATTTTTTTTATSTAVFGGRPGVDVFRPRLHVANRTTMAVVAPWKRMLARLPRKW